MLKILRKCPISLKDWARSQEIKSLKINEKYIRTVLDFDGSMTKFVMNLSEGDNKPLIKIIKEKEVNLTSIEKLQTEQSFQARNTLVDLKQIFQTSKQKQYILIQRSIQFYLVKQQDQNKPKLLYFARSFWNKEKYEQIMSKSKNKPIGINLIEQQVELFRKLNWTGLCDLEIVHQNPQQNSIYKNLCSRSYTMLNEREPLCELQQFFLPQMFYIFTEK